MAGPKIEEWNPNDGITLDEAAKEKEEAAKLAAEVGLQLKVFTAFN